MSDRSYTVAVAVNNRDVLQKNLYLSPGLQEGHKHQILIKENYTSASLAYNSAIDDAQHDIIIFIHQDIYLPENWFIELGKCLIYLAERNVDWGVLGCFGSRKDAHGGLGRVYTIGLGFHGRELTEPEPVDTLDEIVLVIKKSSGLRFDVDLPHFHWYGTDICMEAKKKGMSSFAFQGLCVHNTNQLLVLPKEFYEGYFFIKKKWSKFLPIYASCIVVSAWNKGLWWNRMNECLSRILGKKIAPQTRVDDPSAFIRNKEHIE